MNYIMNFNSIPGNWQGISLWINNLQSTTALKDGNFCKMKKPMRELSLGSEYEMKYIK